MSKTEKLLFAVIIVLCSVILSTLVNWQPKKVEAQGTGGAYTEGVATGTTIANCPAPIPAYTLWCYAGDGSINRSINGAAFVAYTGGVTSFNGQTGAITYTAPVVSVNGKTGTVVLGATATAPAVTATAPTVTLQ
jgi:hypothetical protein